MGFLQQHFGPGGYNVAAAPPTTDGGGNGDLIPAGNYPAVIDSAEVRETKKKDGHYLEILMAVADGPMRGKTIVDRINFNNPNPQAVQIAMGSLSALGIACRMPKVDETMLPGQSVVVHVKVSDDGKSNKVRTYSSFADYQSVPQQPAPPVVQQPPMQQPPQQQWQPPQQPQWQQPAPPAAPPQQPPQQPGMLPWQQPGQQ